MDKWIVCTDFDNYISDFSKEENRISLTERIEGSYFFGNKRDADRMIETMAKKGHDMSLFNARKVRVNVYLI